MNYRERPGLLGNPQQYFHDMTNHRLAGTGIHFTGVPTQGGSFSFGNIQQNQILAGMGVRPFTVIPHSRFGAATSTMNNSRIHCNMTAGMVFLGGHGQDHRMGGSWNQMNLHGPQNQMMSRHPQNGPMSFVNPGTVCMQQQSRPNIPPLMSQGNFLMGNGVCQQRNLQQMNQMRMYKDQNQSFNTLNSMCFQTKQNNVPHSTHQQNTAVQNQVRNQMYYNVPNDQPSRTNTQTCNCHGNLHSMSRPEYHRNHLLSRQTCNSDKPYSGSSDSFPVNRSRTQSPHSSSSTSVTTESVHVERIVTCRREVTRSGPRSQDRSRHHWWDNRKNCDHETVTVETRETILRRTPVHSVFEYNHNSPKLTSCESLGESANFVDFHRLKSRNGTSASTCTTKYKEQEEMCRSYGNDSFSRRQNGTRDYNQRSSGVHFTEHRYGHELREKEFKRSAVGSLKVSRQENSPQQKVCGRSFVLGDDVRHRRSLRDRSAQLDEIGRSSRRGSTCEARRDSQQSSSKHRSGSIEPGVYNAQEIKTCKNTLDSSQKTRKDSDSATNSTQTHNKEMRKDQNYSSAKILLRNKGKMNDKPDKNNNETSSRQLEFTDVSSTFVTPVKRKGLKDEQDSLTLKGILRKSLSLERRHTKISNPPSKAKEILHKSLGRTLCQTENQNKVNTSIQPWLSSHSDVPESVKQVLGRSDKYQDASDETSDWSFVDKEQISDLKLVLKQHKMKSETNKNQLIRSSLDQSNLWKVQGEKQKKHSETVDKTSSIKDSCSISSVSFPKLFDTSVDTDGACSHIDMQNPPKFWSPDYRFMITKSTSSLQPDVKKSGQILNTHHHFMPRALTLKSRSVKAAGKHKPKKSVFSVDNSSSKSQPDTNNSARGKIFSPTSVASLDTNTPDTSETIFHSVSPTNTNVGPLKLESEILPIPLQSVGSTSSLSDTSESVADSSKSPDRPGGSQDKSRHNKNDNLTITIVRAVKHREQTPTADHGERRSIMSPVMKRTNVRTCILSRRKPKVQSSESSPVDQKLLKDARVQMEDLNLTRLARTRVPKICLGDRFALQQKGCALLKSSSENAEETKDSNEKDLSSVPVTKTATPSHQRHEIQWNILDDHILSRMNSATESVSTASNSTKVTHPDPPRNENCLSSCSSLLKDSVEGKLRQHSATRFECHPAKKRCSSSNENTVSSKSCSNKGDVISKRKAGRPPGTKNDLGIDMRNLVRSGRRSCRPDFSVRSCRSSTDQIQKKKPVQPPGSKSKASDGVDSTCSRANSNTDQILRQKSGRPPGSKKKVSASNVRISLHSSSVSSTSCDEQARKRKRGRLPGSKAVRLLANKVTSSRVYHCSQIMGGQSEQKGSRQRQEETMAKSKVMKTVTSLSRSSVTHTADTQVVPLRVTVSNKTKNSKPRVSPCKVGVAEISEASNSLCKVTPLKIPLSRLSDRYVAKMNTANEDRRSSLDTAKRRLLKKGVTEGGNKEKEHKHNVVMPLKISGSVVTKKTVKPLRLSVVSGQQHLSADVVVQNSGLVKPSDVIMLGSEKICDVRKSLLHKCHHSADLNLHLSDVSSSFEKSSLNVSEVHDGSKQDSASKECEFETAPVTVASCSKQGIRRPIHRKRKSSGSSGEDLSGGTGSAVPESEDDLIAKKTRISDRHVRRRHTPLSDPSDVQETVRPEIPAVHDPELTEQMVLNELITAAGDTDPSTDRNKLHKHDHRRSNAKHRQETSKSQNEHKQSKQWKSHRSKGSTDCNGAFGPKESLLHHKSVSSKSQDRSRKVKHGHPHLKRNSSEELDRSGCITDDRHKKCCKTKGYSGDSNRSSSKSQKESQENSKHSEHRHNEKRHQKCNKYMNMLTRSLRKSTSVKNNIERKTSFLEATSNAARTGITFNLIRGDQLSQHYLRRRTCLYCRTFSTRLEQIMKEHIRTNHPHKCCICHIAFKDQLETRAHRLTRHLSEVHHCMLCQQVFMSEHKYRKHIKSKGHLRLVGVQKEAIDAICGIFFQNGQDSVDDFSTTLRRIQRQEGKLWDVGLGKRALPAPGDDTAHRPPQPPNLSHLRHFYYDNPDLQKAVQNIQDIITSRKIALKSGQIHNQTLSLCDTQEETFFFPLASVEDSESWTITSESESDLSSQVKRVEDRDILEMSLSEVLGAALTEWKEPDLLMETADRADSSLKYPEDACVVIHDMSMSTNSQTVERPFLSEGIVSAISNQEEPNKLTSWTKSLVSDSSIESDDSVGHGCKLLPLLSSYSRPCQVFASNTVHPEEGSGVPYTNQDKVNRTHPMPLMVPHCAAADTALNTDFPETDDPCSDNDEQDSTKSSDQCALQTLPTSTMKHQTLLQSESVCSSEAPRPLTVPPPEPLLPKPLALPSDGSDTLENSGSLCGANPLTTSQVKTSDLLPILLQMSVSEVNPLDTDSSPQVAIDTDNSPQVALDTDSSPQVAIGTDSSKQVPVDTDSSPQIPKPLALPLPVSGLKGLSAAHQVGPTNISNTESEREGESEVISTFSHSPELQTLVTKASTFSVRDVVLCQSSVGSSDSQRSNQDQERVPIGLETSSTRSCVSDVPEQCRLKAEINQILKEIAEDESAVSDCDLLTGRPS